MGTHASIRGVLTLDLVPEFLYKYMDDNKGLKDKTDNNQHKIKTDNKSLSALIADMIISVS